MLLVHSNVMAQYVAVARHGRGQGAALPEATTQVLWGSQMSTTTPSPMRVTVASWQQRAIGRQRLRLDDAGDHGPSRDKVTP
jgi:hypothetical protein